MNLPDRLGRLLPGLARASVCNPEGKALVRGRHIYIFPTGSGLVFGAILLVMLLGSLNYQNNLGLLFTFLTTSAVLVGLHHTWFNLLGITVSARSDAPVFAGERARFRIRLENHRRAPRPDLTVVGPKERGRVDDVGPGEEAGVQIGLLAQARGHLPLGRISIETRYPLGLFRAWTYVETGAATLVYPRPASRGPAPSPTPAYRPSSAGDQGVGVDDFFGLRGYRPGDSPRQLDWKAFGKERGLLVKQFGGDRADQIWLDWERLPDADTETRLSLLCRQVLDAAGADLNFGLRLPGREVPLGQGDAHKHRCLVALARFGG
jgi:uncharacterized protein (DUF58 family)